MHPDGHDSHTLRFSLILFLLYFLVIAVLVYLLVSLIGKLKQR